MGQAMSNADVVRKVTELVSNFQFDEIEQYIHDEIVMEAPYQAFNHGPMRRGRKKFMEGVAFIPQVFEKFKLNICELYECQEKNTVIIEQTSFGVFVANKGTYQNRYVMVYGFRDGKIDLWREYFNPEVMNAGMICLLD